MIQNAKKPSQLVSVLSVMVAIVLLSTSVLASGVVASAAEIGTSEKNVIEVYNDTTKLCFTNQPFFENGEVYLPLRETLAGFGITDVRWNDGSIYVGMLSSTHYETSLPQTSDCELTIGSTVLNFPSISKGFNIKFLPIVKNGITYVSMDFFEALIAHGQVPRFRVNLVQSRNSKDYYAEGEEVYIGIGEKQDNYKPVDESGRPKLVKRIITNEAGEVLFVATVENQKPEVIASKPQVDTGSRDGFARSGVSRIIFTNAYGEDVDGFCGIFVYQRTGDNSFVNVAYIPPKYQIDHSAGEVSKSILSMETLIELAKKGDALSFEDFVKFESKDIGHGERVLEYVIDDTYRLLIRGISQEGKPQHIELVNQKNDQSIDIRYEDVQKFIDEI